MRPLHLGLVATLLATACGSTDPANNGSSAGAGAGSSAGTPASGSTSAAGGASTGTGQGGSGATGGTPPTSGCFAPGEVPPSVAPSGFAVPSLDDERNTYMAWGLTWAADAEPNVPAEPGYTVSDPDIHGDTEGDDLWAYTMMSLRTMQPGYADRAKAWARYFKEDYRSCVGDPGASFCYDRDAFGADHLWGWGLIAYADAMDDAAALEEAKNIGAVLEELWGPNTTFGCLPSSACTTYGVRQVGRHLIFASRLAEVTGEARWATLRDAILERLLASEDWDATLGTWVFGEYSTDNELGAGAYAGGARLVSAFQQGVLSEGLDHAYRTTGRAELRDRMVAMAGFVDKYGLDPTYQYTASYFGVVNGNVWHSYSATPPVDYWDPVYTTSLVNILVRGYRYSCDAHFYDRARLFFERGNRGIYGDPVGTATPDGTIHHFVDSRFASASGDFYLDYNKGELQYTYLIFEPPRTAP